MVAAEGFSGVYGSSYVAGVEGVRACLTGALERVADGFVDLTKSRVEIPRFPFSVELVAA
jgi:hypothetical protein